MTKGYSITIALPSYVHDYIKALAKKMANTWISNPETGEIVANPQTGKPMPMVATGSIEELIHQCILYNIYPLVLSHPSFTNEKKDIDVFREEYGKYISSIIHKHFINNMGQGGGGVQSPQLQQQSPSTTTSTTVTSVNKTVTKGNAKKKG